jgi:hypothetical protein
MSRPNRRALTALFASAVLFAQSGKAQEVGLIGSRGSSELSELEAPGGIGLFVRVPATPFLSVRVEAYQLTHPRSLMARVCLQAGGTGCREELIHRKSRYQSLAIVGAFHYNPTRLVELEAGAGVAANRIFGDDRTESGLPSRLFVHRTLQMGIVVQARGRLRPIRGWPVALEIGVAHNRVPMSACASELVLDDPYCGPLRLTELRVGLGYEFRR